MHTICLQQADRRSPGGKYCSTGCTKLPSTLSREERMPHSTAFSYNNTAFSWHQMGQMVAPADECTNVSPNGRSERMLQPKSTDQCQNVQPVCSQCAAIVTMKAGWVEPK